MQNPWGAGRVCPGPGSVPAVREIGIGLGIQDTQGHGDSPGEKVGTVDVKLSWG